MASNGNEICNNISLLYIGYNSSYVILRFYLDAFLIVDKLGSYTDIFKKLFMLKNKINKNIIHGDCFISPVIADSLCIHKDKYPVICITDYFINLF